MNAVTKISLGLAAVAVVVVGPLTLIAHAQNLSHDLNGQNLAGQNLNGQGAGASARPAEGNGPGDGRWGGQGMGMMNGAGPGAEAMVDYLATELGVATDDVADALRAWHVDNSATMRGRAWNRAAAESRHEAMAAFLAGQLGVNADRVEEALDDRMPGGCLWR